MAKFGTNYQALAHHWMYNNDYSECYGYRMYSENEKIYSYGSHFLLGQKVKTKKYGTVILLSSDTASNTTSHQQRCLLAAIPYDQTYFVVPGAELKHKTNLQYFFNNLEENLLKASRARKYKDDYLLEVERIKSEIKNYSNIFSIRLNKKEKEVLSESLDTDDFQKLKDASNLRLRNEKAKILRQNKAGVRKEQEKIYAWLERKIDRIHQVYDKTVYLRYNKDNDTVETSKSSSVSRKAAKVLYFMIKNGKDIKGHEIDGFRVIGMNGTLKIGCHEITKKEINRFAKLMKW